MNVVLKASVILAVAVSLVSTVVIAVGWHTDPVISSIVPIVAFIALNVGAIIWVLKQTAAENGYGKQLLNGLLVGVIAGVLIGMLSWASMTFIFPDALAEIQDAMIEVFENLNLPQAQLD